jgi:hypothetical protein
MQNLSSGLNAMFRGTYVVNHSFYSIGTKIMFGYVSEHFTNLRHVKRCKTCVSGLNAMFRGTKVVKHTFDSIGPENDVWEYFRAFRLHSTGKRCKTCVSGLNTLFRGTKVVKHPFYSIGHKMMFGSVSDHFTNVRQVKKDARHVFRD